MIARDPRERWTYILVEDRFVLDETGSPKLGADGKFVARPATEQTVHHFRRLTLLEEQQLHLNDLEFGSDGLGVRKNLGDVYTRTLKLAYRGCDNLKAIDGSIVPYEDEGGVVTDAFLMRFTVRQRSELARAVLNEVRVDAVEVGKSEPQSSSPTGT